MLSWVKIHFLLFCFICFHPIKCYVRVAEGNEYSSGVPKMSRDGISGMAAYSLLALFFLKTFLKIIFLWSC